MEAAQAPFSLGLRRKIGVNKNLHGPFTVGGTPFVGGNKIS
jgi:hypothetical protein